MEVASPQISIIIPIYNAEKTLNRCLDSIKQQIFNDFEVLLIDDGSKDSSLTICKSYASKDSRFRVFEKENGGASSARNIGLNNAKGEYIAFCDSDDYVEPDWLIQFINGMSHADIVISFFINLKTKRKILLVILMYATTLNTGGLHLSNLDKLVSYGINVSEVK